MRFRVAVWALLWGVAPVGWSLPSSASEIKAEILSFDWKADRADSGGPQLLADVMPGLLHSRIDAALLREIEGRQKLFLFHGDTLTCVDWATRRVDSGYPRRIQSVFEGVFADGVDAVFEHPYEGRTKLHFFKGGLYQRFDVASGRVDPGYPLRVSDEWRDVFDGTIDEALVAAPGTVYFFKGDRYIRYEFGRGKAVRAQPRAIGEETWNGLWKQDLDAAFFDPRQGKAWFIKHRGLVKPEVFADENVIFITWDGVRHQEFFSGKPDPEIWRGKETRLLPRFWGENAAKGVVLGAPARSGGMYISNPFGISYPAYVTMLNGMFNRQCGLNEVSPECPRNWVETFPERLVREQGTPRRDAVVIASWDRIADAVESVQGRLTVNAGLYPFEDPYFPGAHDAINREQERRFGANPSWRAERPDDLTWAHAMTYLDNHHPRFMYIYLVDTDSLAHQGRYDAYMAYLNLYDLWLDQLIKKLATLGDYGARTTIVLTTDHGRGVGSENWKHHGALADGPSRESVRRVWSYVIGPHTPRMGAVDHPAYSHAYLRPLMERVLGLQPYLGRDYLAKEAFGE